ncbi:MAG: helix-turn-helix transcriptional regulator [Clostridiales bacterium]|nr:helix-turn-helix transcriptional regulator [Clostridiales bacterium]
MFKLKELRKEANLTQEQLAKKLGLKYFNIGDWERGKCEPCIGDLIKLAQIFNVSVDYLIGNCEDYAPTFPTSNIPQITLEEKNLLKWYNEMNDTHKETLLDLAESLYNKRNI